MRPRQLLNEFAVEVRLTGLKYLVVEGPSDRRFFVQWLEVSDLPPAKRPVVISVETLDVDTGELVLHGLNDAARSRVIFVSMFASAEDLSVRCVADRDCGDELASHSRDTLIWTDFPALESYGLDSAALDTLNRMFLRERLPSGVELIDTMAPMLADLYVVRANNAHLPHPNIEKGLSVGGPGPVFDVTLTVNPSIGAGFASYAKPISTDPRAYAYGHDICALLLALHKNAIKNQSKIHDQAHLESLLMASTLLSVDLVTQPLFRTVLDWAA